MHRAGRAFIIAFLTAAVAMGQDAPADSRNEPARLPSGEEGQRHSSGCLIPADVIGWSSYHGPLPGLVAHLSGKVERRAVSTANLKPGTVLCSLTVWGKLKLMGEDLMDPGTYVSVAFNSGLDQWQNTNPGFGRGGTAFAHRFGANLASQASGEFLSGFLFPTVFSEDPRYYRMETGSGSRRLLHALRHTLVAHRDNGKAMPNFSEWFGATGAVVVNPYYHPGALHGFGSAARQTLMVVATDAAFDVLREFWPELARKFRLPFRPAGPATLKP